MRLKISGGEWKTVIACVCNQLFAFEAPQQQICAVWPVSVSQWSSPMAAAQHRPQIRALLLEDSAKVPSAADPESTSAQLWNHEGAKRLIDRASLPSYTTLAESAPSWSTGTALVGVNEASGIQQKGQPGFWGEPHRR